MTKPNLIIKVKHIGPIMGLAGQLSNETQNLIFATSGTGKSFIARAFRVLDNRAFESSDPEKIPESLVSEESEQGEFSIHFDDDCIGRLKLCTNQNNIERTEPSFLFHVFSSDYIDSELRSKKFELDGKIEREIFIGKENFELDEKETEFKKKEIELNQTVANLQSDFEDNKSQLKTTFSMRANLNAFQVLSTDAYLIQKYQPTDTSSLVETKSNYGQFKQLPSDPDIPVQGEFGDIFVDLSPIEEVLKIPVSVSHIANEIKQKIVTNPDFFEIGIQRFQQDNSECPFCTQPLSSYAAEIVDKYTEYFQDAEANAKKNIQRQKANLSSTINFINAYKTQTIETLVDLPRFRAAPGSHLSGLLLKGQGTFPA